jgi:signal transduction histidine kinase
VGVVGAALAAHDWLSPYDEPITVGNYLAYFLTIATVAVAAWALGTLGRVRSAYVDALVERSRRVEREAAQQVELAAAEERARIAREMHDVVAHGLSVMVVQADGARYAAEHDPAVATHTLGTIADTGREALAEMRRLLGLLRSGEVTGTRPQPRLGDISALVEQACAGGTDVRATLPPPEAVVPDGVALTAYRVVQESLTNVRKHAGPGASATITLTVSDALDALDVVVEDDGRGASSTDDGNGLGLVGMRERVGVHDGTLEAGPRPGGGFRVSARIPL